MIRLALAAAVLASLASPALAQQWVASWTGSSHGPYPVGNPTAQPEMNFAFPSPEKGAHDQTFRLIVDPTCGHGRRASDFPTRSAPSR